jgi:protein O-mannosyl-transferase
LAGPKKISLGFVAVFIFGFLCCLPAVKGDFHFDDFHHILNNQAVSKPPGWLYFFTNPESFSNLGKPTLYRPITMISLAVNYKLAGDRAAGYLIFNVLIHGLNAGLFFLLLLKWQKQYLLVLLGALLFACAAVVSQPVSYIANRASLLAAFFVLLALVLDWSAPEKSNGAKIFRIFLAAICFWLALLCKEIAVAFPALVVIEDLFLEGRSRKGFGLFAYALYGLSLIFYLWLRWMMFDTLGSNFYPRSITDNLLVQAKSVFSFYLPLVLWPAHLSVIPEVGAGNGWFDPLVLVALFLIAAISLAALVMMKRAKIFGFVWFWFLITLIPSSLVPLNVVLSVERVYLPSVGLVFGLVRLLDLARQRRKILAYGCFCLLVLFQFGLLEKRLPAWKSESRLWRDCINKSPKISAGYVMYAQSLIDRNQLIPAMGLLEKALVYDPKNPAAYSALCRLYFQKRQPEAARGYADEYYRVSIHPSQKSEALAFQAMAGLMLGDPESAEKSAKESLGMNPRQADALYVMAALANARGEKEQAEQFGRASLESNPELSGALALVGLILVNKGNIVDGFPFLKKYTEVSPEDATGWFNLGSAYSAMGEPEKARAAIKKALGLNPQYAKAYYGLANLDYNLGKKNDAFEEVAQALEFDPELPQARLLQTKLFIDQITKDILSSEAEKKELLVRVREEIKWLKSKGMDTRELESELPK